MSSIFTLVFINMSIKSRIADIFALSSVLIFGGIFVSGVDIVSTLWYLISRRVVIPSVLGVHPGGVSIWSGRSSSSLFYLLSQPFNVRYCSSTYLYHLLIRNIIVIEHAADYNDKLIWHIYHLLRP